MDVQGTQPREPEAPIPGNIAWSKDGCVMQVQWEPFSRIFYLRLEMKHYKKLKDPRNKGRRERVPSPWGPWNCLGNSSFNPVPSSNPYKPINICFAEVSFNGLWWLTTKNSDYYKLIKVNTNYILQVRKVKQRGGQVFTGNRARMRPQVCLTLRSTHFLNTKIMDSNKMNSLIINFTEKLFPSFSSFYFENVQGHFQVFCRGILCNEYFLYGLTTGTYWL